MKQCLLVIDMQNGVFALKRPVFQKEKLIKNIEKTIQLASKRGIQVIFSLHENDTFLKKGTNEYQLVAPLVAGESDWAIKKRRPNILDGSHVEEKLRKVGATSLIVAGLVSNGCVKAACLSAHQKGFKVTLIRDAHTTFYANAAKLVDCVNRDMEMAGVQVIPVNEL